MSCPVEKPVDWAIACEINGFQQGEIGGLDADNLRLGDARDLRGSDRTFSPAIDWRSCRKGCVAPLLSRGRDWLRGRKLSRQSRSRPWRHRAAYSNDRLHPFLFENIQPKDRTILCFAARRRVQCLIKR